LFQHLFDPQELGDAVSGEDWDYGAVAAGDYFVYETLVRVRNPIIYLALYRGHVR
jgi:hypothetical protein